MERFDNGVPANSISDAQWLKSSISSAVGNCVEVAALPQGDVAVRNSRYPTARHSSTPATNSRRS